MECFSPEILAARTNALHKCREPFLQVDEIAEKNTITVLESLHKYQISDYHFRTTTGYAYSDVGRDKLDQVFADVFGAEKALVRTGFVSGTHALATVLFGILRPGDELLSVTGAPYDTMQTVIGASRDVSGSLIEFGITYDELSMKSTGVDLENIAQKIKPSTKMVLIQRSRGYSLRKTLSVNEIKLICAQVKKIKPNCICFIDNCYGEFTEFAEPTSVGADIMAGSLIKNPGGGLAPSGGYIAGRKALVDLAAYRLTAPGIGSELGASLSDNRLLYQGLFLAPHVVAQAVKGAIFAAEFFTQLGYNTKPSSNELRSDIIQAIELKTPEKMVAFCRGLQKFSPIDAHVRPEPSAVPGYADEVIMAAGTFVQGASIELSADGPIRPPYAIYLQGGLTLEHTIIALMGAATEIQKI